MARAAGPVEVRLSADGFLGAVMADNFSAEVSGIIWAVRWALQRELLAPVFVHADNVPAAAVLFGDMAAHAEAKMMAIGKALVAFARKRAVVAGWRHVKGHSGCPWNEACDVLAAQYLLGRVSEWRGPPLPGSFCVAPPQALSWATLLVAMKQWLTGHRKNLKRQKKKRNGL